MPFVTWRPYSLTRSHLSCLRDDGEIEAVAVSMSFWSPPKSSLGLGTMQTWSGQNLCPPGTGAHFMQEVASELDFNRWGLTGEGHTGKVGGYEATGDP